MRDSRLRVAITARAVAPWHGRGGLERHVADLVHHLARRDVAVTLIVPPPSWPAGSRPAADSALVDPALASHVQVVPVPYVTFPGAGRRGTTILDRDTAYIVYGWRAGRLAVRLAREHRIDLVHGLGASVLGYATARRRDPALPPLVFNPQGLEEFGATDPGRAKLKVMAYWPLRQAVRACATAADAVIATDRSLVNVVLRHLAVPQDRVAVVPNAVDLARADALAGPADGRRLRAERGLSNDTSLCLSVGRLEENKGFHVLADALGLIAQRAPDSAFRWVLVGQGPYRDALERRVNQAGLGSRMIWAGRVDDRVLHAWYEAADLFIHPTLYEGSSLVTLEAMAHRRAVIATRAGGLPDKVVPGLTGWLVPPGESAPLAAAVTDALEHRASLADLGRAGRELAAQEFAWPSVAERLVRLYEELRTTRNAHAGPMSTTP